jgi:acyl dehydratase
MDARFEVGELGREGEQRRYEVRSEAISAYAAATDDAAPAARAGRVAPPVFAILPVWDALAPASRAVAPDEARPRVVHYEQDLLLERPIEAGMTLLARATPVGVHVRPNGTTLVIRAETRTQDGELVNVQYVSEFFRGVTTPAAGGDAAPDHRFPEAAKGLDPVAEITYPVAEDQTVRYADASGDRFAIHLDDEAARAVGLPGRIVHGLCTMAFTGRAVLEAAGLDDPGALRRLAVRFSAPLRPGDSLTTRIWSLDGGSAFAFEAADGEGTVVIKDGRAELRGGST